MAAEAARPIGRDDLARAFERAPALVERLAPDVPFASPEAAIARARAILDRMSEGERIAVLDAHPRIGADPRSMSEASRHEQGADGDPALLEELRELNERYERRSGFRFVVFVAGRPRSALVPVLRARLERTREEELATGVGEFLAIARDRLSAG